MKLFQFIVPEHDNDGRAYNPGTLERWEEALVEHAGGFTNMGRVVGVWRDADGVTYRDQSRAYLVALGGNGHQVDAQFALLRSNFFGLFSDQKALFVAEIGTAAIHERPQLGER